MDVLYEIIVNSEKRLLKRFEQHLLKSSEGASSKMYRIFLDEQKGKNKVAAGGSAYYRMKNYLVEQWNDHLVASMIKNKQVHRALIYYLAFEYYFEQKQTKLCAYYLKKSEKMALEEELLEYLDLIYTGFIRHCQYLSFEDPTTYIIQRKNNLDKLNKLRKIDDILLSLQFRMQQTLNLRGTTNVSEEVAQTIRDLSEDKELISSVQFRVKLYKTTVQLLVQAKKYQELEKFLIRTLNEFKQDDLFLQGHPMLYAEMLATLTNTYLMLKDYSQALACSDNLFDELKQNKQAHDAYIYFYYQTQISVYAELQPDKAIELLEQMLKNKKIIPNTQYYLLNQANLAALYFLKKEYKQALKILQQVLLHPDASTLDAYIMTQFYLMDIVIRIEKGDVYALEQKYKLLEQWMKKLNKTDYEQLFLLVKILKLLIFSPDIRTNQRIKEQVRRYLKYPQLDMGFINYGEWLRNKVNL